MRRGRTAWLLAAVMLVTALVRWPLLTRQGLWVDEVFSLAIATGHSLEHPAAEADASLGDFVEGEAPRPARAWRAYLQHDDPPAGPARVVRAVELSDTSPPLYYLVLWAWTRALGTSDAALRALSLACAVACVPILARLARRAGGRAALLPTCALYGLTPLSIYYGTEGRMYALLWLEIVVFVELTLALRARGFSVARFTGWVASAAAAFLTHYFFAFVFAALVAACCWRPRRARRATWLAGSVLTMLAILPWYVHLGESLGRWRVTRDWLSSEPTGFARGKAALELFASFFSGSSENLWGEHGRARAASLALFALLALLLVARERLRAFGGPRLVPWLWLASAWAGPLVFDALRGTYTVAVQRYALAGLPAALVLAGAALAGLRPWARLAMLAALGWATLPHDEMLYHRASRSWCPLREVARTLGPNSGAEDLVLVHSIPSGLLGIARYYEGEAALAPWVGQLAERRVPDSLLALAHGKRRIHLVRIHEVGEPAPEEAWLRAHAVFVRDDQRESTHCLHFRPAAGPSF